MGVVGKETALASEFLSQTLTRIKASKMSFCLGFGACLIVVFVVSLFITIIGKAPVVMLRLAELQSGEIDLLITPPPSSSSSSSTGDDSNHTDININKNVFSDFLYELRLNHTLVDSLLKDGSGSDDSEDADRFSYNTARIVVDDCPIFNPLGCSLNNVSFPDWINSQYDDEICPTNDRAGCIRKICPTLDSSDDKDENDFRRYGVSLFSIDGKREDKMNLGRGWTFGYPSRGKCFLQRNVAVNLGIEAGDTVVVSVDLRKYFGIAFREAIMKDFFHSLMNVSEYLLVPSHFVHVPLAVEKVFDTGAGKFNIGIRSAVIVDYSSFVFDMSQYVDTLFSRDDRFRMGAFNAYEYAQEIPVNLPPPRVDQYLSSDYDKIQKTLVDFGSSVTYLIGFNRISSDMPVLSLLSNLTFLSMFLGLILNVVIFILLFLSIVLIYSLLMTNVETRAFEMGVMRITGITRREVIELLMFQAFSYSFPAWIVGLILSQGFAVVVVFGFELLTGINISPLITVNAFLTATALGILIPVVAGIFPIRTALSSNLSESLDIRRSKTKAAQVSVERTDESRRIKFPLVISGLFLTAFGFFIYYVFPLSLLSFNLSLLLNIFFILLLGMLLGLTLLSLNLQFIIERMVVFLFFWWENRAITKIVLKNLVGHRIRNRKTTVMFALSIAFILFVNVSYSLSINTTLYQMQRSNGAFLKVFVDQWNMNGSVPYRINKISELEEVAITNPHILSYSWISAPLDDAVPTFFSTSITNLGHVFQGSQKIFAASPGIYSTTIDGYLDVEKRVENDDGFTVVEQTYTINGSSSMVIGSLYEDSIGIDLDSHMLLETSAMSFSGMLDGIPQISMNTELTRLQPLAFLDASPAFSFSSFPSVQQQDAIVSFPTYVRLSRGSIRGIEDIPLQTFLLKLKPDLTTTEISAIKAELNSALVGEEGVWIWDYNEEIEAVESANLLMDFFFGFTTAVAMVVSGFSLVSSMYTNIYEQTKEIGILRAIGVHKSAILRIYIYEAFTLVLTSSILGVMIGTFVGYTMTIQRILFTQLPISFVFPDVLLTIVFICSVIFSFISSCGPTVNILKLPIVQIMRMLI